MSVKFSFPKNEQQHIFWEQSESLNIQHKLNHLFLKQDLLCDYEPV